MGLDGEERKKLQFDYYDKDADFKQFYDSTRLVVDTKPIIIDGKKLYNCYVSWYGDSDFQILNEANGKFESSRALDYKNVLAQIDLNLLQTDQEYFDFAMKFLLSQKRVLNYLEEGFKEKPERPCGNYIGGIIEKPEGYRKNFDLDLGEIVHYSEGMKKKRAEEQEKRKRIDERFTEPNKDLK